MASLTSQYRELTAEELTGLDRVVERKLYGWMAPLTRRRHPVKPSRGALTETAIRQPLSGDEGAAAVRHAG